MPRYKIDLHSHCQGDPHDDLQHTVYEHIDRAVEAGLNALAITWHRRVFTDQSARDYAREKGLLLIPGIETEWDKKHVLVLNATPEIVGPTSTLADLKRWRDLPDLFILAPHPYYPAKSCLGKRIDEHPEYFDGVEWCHYHLEYLPHSVSPNEKARRWAQRHGKPLISCSDAHSLRELGLFWSEVEAEELTIPAIFTGLRANRVSFKEEGLSLSYFIRETGEVLWDWVQDAREKISGAKKPTAI